MVHYFKKIVKYFELIKCIEVHKEPLVTTKKHLKESMQWNSRPCRKIEAVWNIMSVSKFKCLFHYFRSSHSSSYCTNLKWMMVRYLLWLRQYKPIQIKCRQISHLNLKDTIFCDTVIFNFNVSEDNGYSTPNKVQYPKVRSLDSRKKNKQFQYPKVR